MRHFTGGKPKRITALAAAASSVLVAAGCAMGTDSSNATSSGSGATDQSTASTSAASSSTTSSSPGTATNSSSTTSSSGPRPSYLPAKLGSYKPGDTMSPEEFTRLTVGANRAANTLKLVSTTEGRSTELTSYLDCKVNGMYAQRDGTTFMIVRDSTQWYLPDGKSTWEKSPTKLEACDPKAKSPNKEPKRVIAANAEKTVLQYDAYRDDKDHAKGKESTTVTIQNSTGYRLRMDVEYKGDVEHITYSEWGKPVQMPAAPPSESVTASPTSS